MSGPNRTAFGWLGWEQFELDPNIVMSVSEADNLAYAKAVVVCANGDGRITDKEREWIIGYLTTVGDSPAVIEAIQSYQGEDTIEELMKATPMMPATRRIMIYDALRACAADGELHSGERERVLQMADRIGMSRQVVAELEEIVEQEKALRQRRHRVIIAEGMAEAQAMA